MLNNRDNYLGLLGIIYTHQLPVLHSGTTLVLPVLPYGVYNYLMSMYDAYKDKDGNECKTKNFKKNDHVLRLSIRITIKIYLRLCNN